MSFCVVIPARFASTRLPGKPLALIHGKTMIEHVYHRAAKSAADNVVVATDDVRIADVVKGFGGKVCMTLKEHNSGTDRLQEVAHKLGLNDNDIVVNVQGDEPLIPAEVINQVANNLARYQQASVATLCEPLSSTDDFQNPNAVKVVRDDQNFALYFSRSPIPFPRDTDIKAMDLKQLNFVRRHIGLYAYKVSLLNRFVRWPQVALERIESLEQLRVLAYGEKIHVDDAKVKVPAGVDTQEDLDRVCAILEKG